MTYDIELEENPGSDDLAALAVGLTEHATSLLPRPGFRRVALFHRGEHRQVLGGLSGLINWNWAFVQNFWVAEALRHRHLGSQLLREFESYARAQGCAWIHLDTFSFQAPDFYETRGYQRFASLDDYPEGCARYFYKKAL